LIFLSAGSCCCCGGDSFVFLETDDSFVFLETAAVTSLDAALALADDSVCLVASLALVVDAVALGFLSSLFSAALHFFCFNDPAVAGAAGGADDVSSLCKFFLFFFVFFSTLWSSFLFLTEEDALVAAETKDTPERCIKQR